MKTLEYPNLTFKSWWRIAGLLCFCLLPSVFCFSAHAQGTAFTYQGRLNSSNGPAGGIYDLRFTIYDSSNQPGVVIAGPLTNSATGVSNGLFTITLAFGVTPFTGVDRWLEIAVRTNGAGAFTTLSPRQQLTPTPSAIFANTASNLSGTIANGALPASPTFSGTVAGSTFSGSGANLTSLNAGNVSSGTLADARLSTNVALRAGGNAFSDDQFFNGAIYLNSTNGFDQSSVGNFYVDAPYIPGGRFAVLTNGYVGIDNPDPLYTLDVNGNMNLAPPATIYSGGNPFISADGSANFFAGLYAGSFTAGGFYNVGIGYGSLYYNTNGNYNTASGAYALFSNTRGLYNTADGYQALYANADGFSNTALGYQALYSSTSGSGNTASGVQALYSNVGYDNTADGGGALQHNTDGSQNTATGGGALYSNTTGDDNTANGMEALGSNTTGNNNTGSGAATLYNNITGSHNTAMGYQSLYSNTNGSNNTAAGDSALFFNLASGNTGLGWQALYSDITGDNNTAVGASALFSNISVENSACGSQALAANTAGAGNTAVGYAALGGNTSGSHNIALGQRAGYNISLGSSNIDIGNLGTAGDVDIIRIGDQQAKTFIAGISGVGLSPAGAAVFVNSSGQLGTINSSARYKQDIRNMGDTSDALLSLRPVTFRYKQKLDPSGTPQFGLIAEEVESVDPDLVLRDNNHQVYTVRYEAVDAMLLNEFLKQHRKITDQNEEIQSLKQQNETLEKRLDNLEQMIKSLTVKN